MQALDTRQTETSMFNSCTHLQSCTFEHLATVHAYSMSEEDIDQGQSFNSNLIVTVQFLPVTCLFVSLCKLKEPSDRNNSLPLFLHSKQTIVFA